MRLNRTIGLDEIRFDELVDLVGGRIEWNSPTGRPKALTLEQAVRATLIYFKNNATEEVIAELMFVDQSTISRTIADFEAAIADALDDWVPRLRRGGPGNRHRGRRGPCFRSTSSIRPTCPATRGYVGTGIITPFKKPPGGELLDWRRKFNADINSRRYLVERAIANFKVWRVLFTEYRRPLSTYEKAFTAVRALYFYSRSSA